MSELLIVAADLVGGGRADLGVRDGVFVDPATVRPDAERIDADGLVALPGLVDLHTHLREPGREDAETVASGTLAAARGGFTAVLAMANLNPVTDTAEAAEHVAALGRAAGNAEVVPVGAVSKGLAGAELAELGLMARAGLRLFSDDGRCVADARLMRRALEYVRAFDGVVAQHAQDPQLAGPDACCHEGELSGRLGLPGWPAAAESTIVARDVQLAELTRSRLHVCHVSTAETVDVLRWAKRRGVDVTAEVAPHHLMLTTRGGARLRPDVQGEPAAAARPNTSRCCATRSSTAPSTPWPPTTRRTPGTTRTMPSPRPPSACWGWRRRWRSCWRRWWFPDGSSGPDVALRMSTVPAQIARLSRQGRQLAEGEPANLVLVDPAARAVVDRNTSASLSRNNPWHGRELPDPVVATLWAGRITYRR